MKDCPYCLSGTGCRIQPHYTTHTTAKGKTWIAYCPSCGARTPYTKDGNVKTLEQAKESWNGFHLIGKVCHEDIPMQTFSP